MSLQSLRNKWDENCEDYKTSEVGSGVHSFIADALESDSLFALKQTAKKSSNFHTFVHETESTKAGRPDFVIYISSEVTIPVEAKCYTRIEEGVAQLRRYQVGLDKQFGILTDGNEWRFYRGAIYRKFLLSEILDRSDDFLVFWRDYIKHENYYIELFSKSRDANHVADRIDLSDAENRKLFFDDTTRLIASFKVKMQGLGACNIEKTAVETSYAYLIQFILYKVLVDNCYAELRSDYDAMMNRLAKAIRDKDFYKVIVTDIREMAEYVSRDIYRPFEKEQESITTKLVVGMKNPTIDEVAPWLDIIAYIDKYSFANLKNEIFGFVYENYLKDLYHDKNKGQYFTDPAVVNFMLEEMGYDEPAIKSDPQNISIIDPSCGAGTFLYSAVDRIVSAIDDNTKHASERIEELIDKNVFGLDIEEFPLYLAEMSILMRLLPLIVADDFKNPIANKFKIFKTKDSIAEFLDTGIGSDGNETDLFSHLQTTALGYESFMRDDKDLQEMLESMQNRIGGRRRFDYVVGNPPYVGYNECCKQGVECTKLIRDAENKSLTMNNVYGVNLHSVPSAPKKYAPKPNLFSFFLVLGLALLKDGGRLCYIVPQTLLTAGDLDVLRYHLSTFATIEKIVTFEGNLFIGRGLQQTRPVATSSLIFVVRKAAPRANHAVKVVNYAVYTEKQADNFAKYLRSRNKITKTVSQSELAKRIENWNFIKQDDSLLALLEAYQTHSHSIEEYRRTALGDYNEVQFDKGLVFDKAKINRNNDGWRLVQKSKDKYSVSAADESIADRFVRLPQGAQGFQIFENRYKILWRYMNSDRFRFSKHRIMLDFNWVIISSNNQREVLFLLAILNSALSGVVFDSFLRNQNEAALLIGIKSIKQYIRVPKITPKNQSIKDEIISQTGAMLALEDVKLSDVVNFSSVRMQKFSDVSVVRNKLVLGQGENSISVPIPTGSAALVQTVVQELPAGQITLSHLKNLEAIDFEMQSQIKDYIDDLVFALYFQVPLRNISFDAAGSVKTACRKNEFYEIVNGER